MLSRRGTSESDEVLTAQISVCVLTFDRCIACPAQTFNFDGRQCRECPDNAVCRGSSVAARPGFYADCTANPPQMHECPDCLENECQPGQPHAINVLCINGHRGTFRSIPWTELAYSTHLLGRLCSLCGEGLVKWAGRCVSCELRPGIIILYIVLLFLALILLLQLKVRQTSP